MATASAGSAPPFSRHPFIRRVERFCRERDLLPPGSAVLAAVSGGADSVFLLHALHSLAPVLDFSLRVAHFDHRWRGVDSEADARFVGRLAGELRLPFHAAANKHARQKAEKRSPEEAARAARYRFLAGVAAEVGAGVVATGHTLDDQVETYLLGWLRGAGPAGLGMPASAPLPAGRTAARVVRPLLPLSATEIRETLRRAGLPWREDPTNADPRYLRNRVRHELLPLLESLSPGFRQTILRSAQLSERAADYLGRSAGEAYERAFRAVPGGLEAARSALLAHDPALHAPVLLHAVERLTGSAHDVESAHLDAATRLISRGAGGRSTPLGPDVTLTLSRGAVSLKRTVPAAPDAQSE